MDALTRERLAELLQKIRGSMAIRAYCRLDGISLGYQAWQAWENKESFPSFENLRIIARLAGLSMNQLDRYLETGETMIEDGKIAPEKALEILQMLSFTERLNFAHRLVNE